MSKSKLKKDKRAKLTSQNKKEIIRLYSNGETYTELGKKFKVHHTTIIYFLKKVGLWEKKKVKPRIRVYESKQIGPQPRLPIANTTQKKEKQYADYLREMKER